MNQIQAMRLFRQKSAMSNRYGYDSLRGVGYDDLNNLGQFDFIQDIVDIVAGGGEKVIERGKQIIGEESSDLVKNIIASTEFQQILDTIEQRAQNAVVKEAGKNAAFLMAFAVAGGAIGGAIFKGPIGMIAASGVAAWAGLQIISGSKSEK